MLKLDGLRGIFSLMVVFYHYEEVFMPAPLYNNFLVRQSYLFVDYFFVLSGFVIAMNYDSLKSFKMFKVFLKKRFIRLYPLLFYTVNVYLIYHLFSNILLKSIVPSLFEIEEYTTFDWLKYFDSLLLSNSTGLLGNTLGINYPSWSISAEMISYFLFGAVSVLIVQKWRGHVLLIVAVACCFLGVQLEYFNHSGSYGFIRSILGFNVGALVWRASFLKIKFNKYLEYCIPIALLIMFYQVHQLSNQFDIYILIGVIAIPLFFGFSILFLVKSNGPVGRLLESRLMQFLGLISYSIYLNHAFVIDKIPEIAFKALKLDINITNQIIIFLICILLLIIYSYLTYIYVEKRVGRFLKSKLLVDAD